MSKSTSLPLPSSFSLLKVQVKYQFKLLARTPRLIVSAFILPLLILWIRHSTGGTPGTTADLESLGGVATFGVMSVCFSILAVRLVSARESGVLKRLRAAPLPPVFYFAGQIVASIGLALLAVGVTILFGYTEHIHLAAHVIPAVIIAVLIGSLAWSACGVGIATAFRDVSSAQALLQAILLPLIFFSGVLFTTSQEPHWLATLASWLPAEPFVDMMTKSLQLQSGWFTFPIRDVLILLGWAIVSIIIAVRYFSWEPYRSAGHVRHKQKVAYDN
jgi:ABC-2 type transport system permease protein